MKKIVLVGVLAAVLLAGTPAEAAALSKPQADAIISLLVSFGVDKITIEKVRKILLADKPDFTLTSPKGGDVYKVGNKIKIAWQTTGNISSSDRVYLVLEKEKGSKYTFASAPAYAAFEWEWSPFALDEGTYRISLSKNGDRYDAGDILASSGYFTITNDSIPKYTNSSPEINVSPTIPSSIKVGQSVEFSWTAADKDNDDLSWSVDWGENISQVTSCSIKRNQTGTGWTYTTSHTWVKPGVYTVKVTVSDCVGGSDSETMTVTVAGDTSNRPPVINGIGGPTTLKVGEMSTWTINASDPENGMLFYSILWGDEPQSSFPIMRPIGSVAQTSTFTHRYATAGNYTVKVSVSDGRESASTSISVTVTNPADDYCKPVVVDGITYSLDPCPLSFEMIDGAGNKPFTVTIKQSGPGTPAGYGFAVYGYGEGFPTYATLGVSSGGAYGNTGLSLYFNDGVLFAGDDNHRRDYRGYLPIKVWHGSATGSNQHEMKLGLTLSVLPPTSNSAYVFSPDQLADAKINSSYYQSLVVLKEKQKVYGTLSVAAGSLPPGIKLEKYRAAGTCGDISACDERYSYFLQGRPTSGGTYIFSLLVSVNGTMITKQYSLRVLDPVRDEKEAKIREMYKQYLAREADPEGLSFWMYGDIERAKRGILNSPEYSDRVAKIKTLFQSLLNRTPNEIELDQYANHGLTLGEIEKQLKPSKYPGFFISFSQKSYLPTETVTATISRADGTSAPYVVDAYIIGTQGLPPYPLRSGISISQGTIAFEMNTQSAYTGPGQYALLLCDGGQKCDGGITTNSANFTVADSVAPQPSITVLSPNGGEKYVRGDSPSTGDWLSYTANIADAKIGNFWVYLTTRNDAEWRKGYYMSQAGGHDVDGSITKPYVVQGGVQLNNSIIPGNYYLLVEWTDKSGTVYRDFSDSYFTITSANTAVPVRGGPIPVISAPPVLEPLAVITYAPLPLPSAELKPGSNVIYRFSATSADGGVVDISKLQFKIIPTANLYVPSATLFAYSDLASKKPAAGLRKGYAGMKNAEQKGEPFVFSPVYGVPKDGIPIASGETLYFEVTANVGAVYGASAGNACAITSSLEGLPETGMKISCTPTPQKPDLKVVLPKISTDRKVPQKSLLDMTAEVYDPSTTNGVLSFYLAKTNGEDWKNDAYFFGSSTGNPKMQYPLPIKMGINMGTKATGTYYISAEWKNDKGFSMAAFSEPITIVAE